MSPTRLSRSSALGPRATSPDEEGFWLVIRESRVSRPKYCRLSRGAVEYASYRATYRDRRDEFDETYSDIRGLGD